MTSCNTEENLYDTGMSSMTKDFRAHHQRNESLLTSSSRSTQSNTSIFGVAKIQIYMNEKNSSVTHSL